jgi:hypothetical protein
LVGLQSIQNKGLVGCEIKVKNWRGLTFRLERTAERSWW